MKNLAELKSECAALGITVKTEGRPSKEPYISALRDHLWQRDHPGEPLPTQVHPMLLGDWNNLSLDQAREIVVFGRDLHAAAQRDQIRARRIATRKQTV